MRGTASASSPAQGGRLVALSIFPGLLWLAILIGLTLTDYLSRGWISGPPPF